MGKKEEESFFSLDSILRVLCCRKTRTINTENIDKIKKIHDDIKHGVDSSRDLTFMSRSTRFDLCVWSNQILKCLSEIKDDRETKKQTEELIKHLETMRSFYKTVEKLRAYEIKNVNELFVGIQYYECIMSLAFIIFQEYPKTISAISSQLTRVEQMLTKSGQSSAPRKIRLSNESANEVDDAIEFVDAKIGEFGLVSIAEFIADIIEVFCQYVGGRMDLERTNIGLANEFLGKLLAAIGPKLNAVNSEYDSPEKRLSNWALLPLSQRIQARADRLESGSATVRRLMFSFERFYKSMIRLGDDFDKMFRRFNGMKFENVDDQHAMMDEESRRMKNGVAESQINAEKPPSRKSSHERMVKNGEILEDQMSKLILRFDPSRVELPYNVEMFMEVEKIGRSIQKIEAIISTLIMWFKNEEHIINPLIGHLDECTRIVEKYIRLNVVYKLVYGSNFLSKLKIVYARIESLMETSRVILSSSREINAEFKRSFPELLYILYDSFLNAKAKAQPKENSKRSLVQVEDIVNQVLSNSFQSQSHFF